MTCFQNCPNFYDICMKIFDYINQFFMIDFMEIHDFINQTLMIAYMEIRDFQLC